MEGMGDFSNSMFCIGCDLYSLLFAIKCVHLISALVCCDCSNNVLSVNCLQVSTYLSTPESVLVDMRGMGN